MDQTRLAPAAGGHVVLCGLNELGYRTLEELRRMGEEVVIGLYATKRGSASRSRRAVSVPGDAAVQQQPQVVVGDVPKAVPKGLGFPGEQVHGLDGRIGAAAVERKARSRPHTR
jgi:hypothetical protein